MKKIKILGCAIIVVISTIMFVATMNSNRDEVNVAPKQTNNPVSKESIDYGPINLEGNIDIDSSITNEVASRMLGLYYGSSLSDEDKVIYEAKLNLAIKELEEVKYTYKTRITEDTSKEVSPLLPENKKAIFQAGNGKTITLTQLSTYFTASSTMENGDTENINKTSQSYYDIEDKYYTSPFVVKYSNLILELGSEEEYMVFENPFPGVIINYTILNANKDVLAKTGDVASNEMFFLDKEKICDSKYNNIYIVVDIYNAVTKKPIIKGLWSNEMIYN